MATIQTTQLEERETGDIKQLRDHDIAEGPVSTNSADATSLKSVPLTLEDGSIIKVRFDSLVTAIGQALGASEDSTVTKVLGLNGTVPKGIGMANLASVLGGATPYEQATISKGSDKTFAMGKGLYHFYLAGSTPLSYYILTDEVDAIKLNSRWTDSLITFTSRGGNLNVAVDSSYSDLSVNVKKLIIEP